MPKTRLKTTKASKAETAKHFGISLTTLDNWLRRGCPHSLEGGHRVFDLEEVHVWRELQEAKSSDPYLRELCSKPLSDLIEDAYCSQAALSLVFATNHASHARRPEIKKHLLSICNALVALSDIAK